MRKICVLSYKSDIFLRTSNMSFFFFHGKSDCELDTRKSISLVYRQNFKPYHAESIAAWNLININLLTRYRAFINL